MKLFLRSKITGKRFEIIRRDTKAGTVTLKGELAEFDEKFDPDMFKKQGYVLEKEDEDDGVQA